jgi:hypothetical protein
MAQELLHYQPTEDRREGWSTRIAKLVAIANKDPTLGGAQGAGEPDPVAGHRASGAGNGKTAQAKKAVSRAASLPRREPSCQIIQRAPQDAPVSLERRRENHDRALDDIGKAGKNVKVTAELISNPRCLALARQQRYMVWPDKFRPDKAHIMTGLPTPSSSSSSTSSLFRPRVEINV